MDLAAQSRQRLTATALVICPSCDTGKVGEAREDHSPCSARPRWAIGSIYDGPTINDGEQCRPILDIYLTTMHADSLIRSGTR
jgi:hypothetical protein